MHQSTFWPNICLLKVELYARGKKLEYIASIFLGDFFFAKKEFSNLIGHTCGVVFYELIGNIHVQISEASFFASKLWNNFEVFKVLQKCPYKGNLVHFLLDIYLFQFIKNFLHKACQTSKLFRQAGIHRKKDVKKSYNYWNNCQFLIKICLHRV